MFDPDEAKQLLEELFGIVDRGPEPARSAVIGLLTSIAAAYEAPLGLPDASDPQAYAYGLAVGKVYSDVGMYAVREAGLSEIAGFIEDTPERKASRLREGFRIVDDEGEA